MADDEHERDTKKPTELSKAQKKRLLVNSVVFGVAMAVIPFASQAMMPWLWVKLTAVEGLAVAVAGVALFVLKDDVALLIRDWFVLDGMTRILMAIVLAEGLIFGSLSRVLPRADDPIVRVLPYGAYLSAPLERGAVLQIDLEGSRCLQIANPSSAAVYFGDGEWRVAWRISDDAKESKRLDSAARATLTFLEKSVDASRAAVDRWSQSPIIRSTAVTPQKWINISLMDGGVSVPLVLYRVNQGVLQRVDPPVRIPSDGETTYVVMREN